MSDTIEKHKYQQKKCMIDKCLYLIDIVYQANYVCTSNMMKY